MSLRIVNWIKWSLGRGEAAPEWFLRSLAEQADSLARQFEYHLLGNHLWANAKALAFAGAYFEQERWLRQGVGCLTEQLREQMLADGGHFERSPMYHALFTEDLLDLMNLGALYPGRLPDLRREAARALGWLAQMTLPDGGLPHFNDCAEGGAAALDDLGDYASRLGIVAEKVTLGESGYVRLERGRAVVLFDAAPVGPDYQPGHAHADALSFELSVNGQRVLVNSGTSTYEAGEERDYERSTAAHNTAVVDGENQSEVWGAFRVARRARIRRRETDGRTWVRAAHDGYRRLQDPVIHERTLQLEEDGLVVRDRFTGAGTHTVELSFHAHPEAEPEIQADPRMAWFWSRGFWRPDFYRRIPNRCLRAQWRGRIPVEFVTEVRWEVGGRHGIRTHDPHVANVVLSQLS